MKREYYIYEGVYYALVKVKGDNFKDGDAIFEINFQSNKITRLNFADVKNDEKNNFYWEQKWKLLRSAAEKITASEFYAAAKEVLKY